MPKQNGTFQEQAYDHIRNRIIHRALKPNEIITDTQVAAELKISRTPVREAFLRLENEGLLVYEPRRGWRVYSLTLEDIQEIFDLKCEIEGYVARKAAQCTDESLRRELENILHEMEAATNVNDPDAWLQADFRLHDVLFRMADSERALRMINNLNDQWHRLRIGLVALQGRITRSTEEHQTFIRQILDHDADGAEQAMQEHLNMVREELIRLLVNMVLPFASDGI